MINISNKENLNIQQFVELLLEENKKINLIGKSTINNIWNRHILDSAQLLRFIENKNLSCVDFGSGAGFPGIILSILGLKDVHLIEKSPRKCNFLYKASKISPNKITIYQNNISEIKDKKFDIIVSRALSPLSKLLDQIKPFCKDSSKSIFLKGRKLDEEIINAKKHHSFEYKIFHSETSNDSKIIIINGRANNY